MARLKTRICLACPTKWLIAEHWAPSIWLHCALLEASLIYCQETAQPRSNAVILGNRFSYKQRRQHPEKMTYGEQHLVLLSRPNMFQGPGYHPSKCWRNTKLPRKVEPYGEMRPSSWNEVRCLSTSTEKSTLFTF